MSQHGTSGATETGLRKGLALTCTVLSSISLAVILLVTMYNALGRRFGFPFLGVMELTEFVMAVAVCAAIVSTGALKGHVTVQFLEERLGPPGRLGLKVAISLVVFIVCIYVVSPLVSQTIYSFEHKQAYEILRLPIFISKSILPLAFLFLAFLQLLDIREAFGEWKRTRGQARPDASPV